MEPRFIPYHHDSYSDKEMTRRSHEYWQWLDKRRTVRQFSDEPILMPVLENLIRAASTAPSGAHKQPWTFCLITDPDLKKEIRIAAEKEEKLSYEQRMPREWLDDLVPFGTDWHKEFLETAPALIIVFRRNYEFAEEGKANNYYVSESVGLATGFLLTAIHHAGLVALTHTPSPMNFLRDILQRPENERPFLLIPVGKPHPDTMVPDLTRKPLDQILVHY
jgi:iodotyrosine deiodinase